MADTDPPWEPPLAGTEAEALAGALDRLRATFRWKVDGLDSCRAHRDHPVQHAHPRRAAQAPRARRGLPVHGEDDGRADGRALGEHGDGRGRPGLGVHVRGRRQPGGALRALRRSRTPLPRAVRRRAGDRRSRRAGRGARRACSTCAGWSATCSRSTAGTPATPTCCARRWTAGAGRTRTRAGCLRSDSGKPGAADKVTLTSPRLGESPRCTHASAAPAGSRRRWSAWSSATATSTAS